MEGVLGSAVPLFIGALWGVGNGVLNTQLSALLGLLFEDVKVILVQLVSECFLHTYSLVSLLYRSCFIWVTYIPPSMEKLQQMSLIFSKQVSCLLFKKKKQ